MRDEHIFTSPKRGHRSGLRAHVLSGGVIERGVAVRVAGQVPA